MHWLEFLAYFVAVLAFFSAVWFGSKKTYDCFERKHEREFREKVDRYRRGNR